MRIREFYEKVTEGMALRDLWEQFRSDAQSSYRLYAEDVDWETLQETPRWQRWLKLTWSFFWIMLMHLSPARRVILLIAFACLFLGVGGETRNRPGFVFLGAAGIMLVLALELADRVTMKRDLQIAREIQRWLVPAEPPSLEGFEVAFSTRPANTVGGDFYDVIVSDSKDPGRVLAVVADVAGKSVPAALLMATFQASLKGLLSVELSLEDLAVGLNRSACERSQGGRRFTTAFIGELGLGDHSFRYINAGHNYPIARRADGRIERLQLGGLPFGIQPDARYEAGAITLRGGDFLLIFTDGVVEAVNSDEAEFGDESLTRLVQGAEEATAGELLGQFKSEIDRFVGPARQHDDMTWMILRVP